MLHGPLRKGPRAAGCLPLVYVKNLFSVHSQTTEVVKQNDPVLTIQFYEARTESHEQEFFVK